MPIPPNANNLPIRQISCYYTVIVYSTITVVYILLQPEDQGESTKTLLLASTQPCMCYPHVEHPIG